MAKDSELTPVANAAVKLRLTREQVVRRIQLGQIEGRQVAGRWFVEVRALATAERTSD